MNTVEKFLTETNLNWRVNSEPIQTESGLIINGYNALIREDTNDVLSVRTDSYFPYQNQELMELLFQVSNQTGLQVHKGGFFGKGEKVFVQLKSNDLRLGSDRIEGYLTGINSFDGSTSLAFGPSNLTISCQNKFFAAFKELDTKVRHTKNMVIRVDEICRSLEMVLVEEQKVFDNIVRLSETRFDDVVKDRITKHLFNIKKEVDLNDVDSISGKTRNSLARFYGELNTELSDKGGDNMWALFSGVTRYTTHSMTKDEQRNTRNKMFGVYGKREKEIFAELVELT